jgi:probable HAF family extracellular repeat protein
MGDDRQRIARRTVLAGTALGAAALAVAPAQAAQAAQAASSAREAGPGAARPRPRGKVTARPLANADGSHPLVLLRDVSRSGQVLGMLDLGDGAADRWPDAVWADGTVTVLQSPVAGASCNAVSVNDLGQAAGDHVVAGRQTATVWTGGEPRVLDIGTLYSTATAVNNLGQVAVRGWNEPGGETATWNTVCLVDGDTVTTVTPPASANGMGLHAQGVDDSGRVLVVGFRPQSGDRAAFLWRDGAVVADFSHIDGYPTYFGLQGVAGPNARGDVAGDYYPAVSGGGPLPRGFLWSAGALHDVPGLGGGNAMVTLFGGRPLNDLGDVVGCTDLGSGVRHPFLLSGGSSTDLGTLGGTSAHPVAVNNRREVAGDSTLSDGTIRAFLWRSGGTTAITPPQGYATTSAFGLTEQGQVIGQAVTADGSAAGYFAWTVS